MSYIKTNWINNSTPINASNLNKIEDELEALDKNMNYSSSEQIVGTWIDGKPIYRIVMYISSLPNNSTLNVDIASLNVEQFVNLRGIGTTGLLMGATRTPSDASVDILPDTTQNRIQIIAYRDRSNASAYLILEYTKNS